MTQHVDTDRLAAIALDAARAGGRAVLDRLDAARTEWWASASDEHAADPVSAADLASEEAIRGVIRERRHDDDAWLTEHADPSAGRSGLRWIVDPLDGTVNVTHGIPRFAVSVAVESEVDNAVIAAAVLRPRSATWLTLSGKTVRSSHAPARVTDADPAAALVAFAVPGAVAVRHTAFLALAGVSRRVQDLRNSGSTVCDLADVATGRLDAFLTVDPKPWDVAAGAGIVEAAGGTSRRWCRSDGLAMLAVGAARVVDALAEWLDV